VPDSGLVPRGKGEKQGGEPGEIEPETLSSQREGVLILQDDFVPIEE